jgi:hypothetical protein
MIGLHHHGASLLARRIKFARAYVDVHLFIDA